jgi:hypothetical protein
MPFLRHFIPTISKKAAKWAFIEKKEKPGRSSWQGAISGVGLRQVVR